MNIISLQISEVDLAVAHCQFVMPVCVYGIVYEMLNAILQICSLTVAQV